MNPRHDRVLLKRLLDLADELGDVRRSQRDLALEPAQRDQLRRRARERRLQAGALLKELGEQGPLQTLLRRYRLGKDHALLLLELLQRRLAHDDPTVKGRELLGVLCDSTFELLEGTRLLAPDSRLVAAGLIVPELHGAERDHELLDLRYRLSDRAFQVLLRALKPRRDRDGASAGGGGGGAGGAGGGAAGGGGGGGGGRSGADRRNRAYKNHLEHLTDMRRLARLYRKRAAKLFGRDDADELDELAASDSLTLLQRQIPRAAAEIEERLARTPESQKFPLVALRAACRLELEHVLVLVTLVFQELTQGTACAPASELLQLVSKSEEDLIRRRKMFGPKSPLVRHGLVAVEEVILDKELSGEVYVPNAIVDRVLGPVRSSDAARIDPATQEQFRKFLSEIDDSEDFFKRL